MSAAGDARLPEDSRAVEDSLRWMSQALDYERIAYRAESTEELNDALLRKAVCYENACAWSEALETLDRVRMYALPEGERRGLMLSKAQILARCGRMDESHQMALELLGSLTEAGVVSDPAAAGKRLESIYAAAGNGKSSDTALILSFLPPLGHFYVGRPGEGLLSMTMNASVVAFAAWQLVGGYYVTGALGGAIALERTFMGGQERVLELAEACDDDSSEAVASALAALFSNYFIPES